VQINTSIHSSSLILPAELKRDLNVGRSGCKQKKIARKKNSQAATLVAMFGGLQIPSQQQLEQLTHGVNKRSHGSSGIPK
jgi:hypothetical protein